MPVGVGVQVEASCPEARVVARGELGYEFVEAAGESFELAVGYSVEDSEGGEELDIGGCELVGRPSFP